MCAHFPFMEKRESPGKDGGNPALDEIEGAVMRLDDVTEKMLIEDMMMQSKKMLSVGGVARAWATRSTIHWEPSRRRRR